MAMPSGNVVIPDKMQFPTGATEIHPQQQAQWFPDERDGFISWLRSEFAAANAIIDSLCHHLGEVSEPGEYDPVIGFIQQRRCNWNPVLYMQHYFPVSEVVVSLQQVALKRKQQRFFDQSKMGGNKEFNNNSHRKSGGGGFRYHQKREPAGFQYAASENERAREVYDESKAGGDITNVGENTTKVAKSQADGSCGNSESESSDRVAITSKDHDNANSTENQDERHSLISVPKTFVGTEIIDGKTVNVVDGLKLYEGMLDDREVSKLFSLVNDMRVAGRKDQLQGQTFVVSKRPTRGHGREVIQLGVPILDTLSEDENVVGTASKERKLEPIPTPLQEIVDRMVGMQLVAIKPDACIIDFYNEGDHSQPHPCPSWYGRPVCMLFLTECDMTFGKTIVVDHPGDFRGSLKLGLAPGSLLVFQGKSADHARHAIHSSRKQRIIITLTKALPRKIPSADIHRQPVTSSSHWGPRSPNHIRPGPKHYAPISTNGVLPAPPFRAPPNGVQFVPAGAVPFPPGSVQIPPGGSNTWGGPRHPPPRFPLPGTGVFLPPQGSGKSAEDSQLETAKTPGKGKSDLNGSVDETSNGKSTNEEQQQNLDSAV